MTFLYTLIKNQYLPNKPNISGFKIFEDDDKFNVYIIENDAMPYRIENLRPTISTTINRTVDSIRPHSGKSNLTSLYVSENGISLQLTTTFKHTFSTADDCNNAFQEVGPENYFEFRKGEIFQEELLFEYDDAEVLENQLLYEVSVEYPSSKDREAARSETEFRVDLLTSNDKICFYEIDGALTHSSSGSFTDLYYSNQPQIDTSNWSRKRATVTIDKDGTRTVHMKIDTTLVMNTNKNTDPKHEELS
jgi:hypothetical protein